MVSKITYCAFFSLLVGLSTGLLNEHPSSLPKLDAAVLVPGFLTGADEFREIEKELEAVGIPTVTVPMPAWHWIPCLGGRSMRPILERVDFTVRHVAAQQPIPQYEYSWFDCWTDFRSNPGGILEVGGSSNPEEYPTVNPCGEFPRSKDPKGKVGLIGHSAGGWISRIYLSDREYGGKSYSGKDLVHSLVTLGTPNANAPGPAFSGIEWCNREKVSPEVRKLAVGGTGFSGEAWGTFTRDAYAFCCGKGSDGTGYDGDGVTPIDSSLAIPDAQRMTIDDCHHFCWSDVAVSNFVSPELFQDHKSNTKWYGSKGVVQEWANWLLA